MFIRQPILEKFEQFHCPAKEPIPNHAFEMIAEVTPARKAGPMFLEQDRHGMVQPRAQSEPLEV